MKNIELINLFEKSMQRIGTLIDWDQADVLVWIEFQTRIIKLISEVNIDTIEYAIKDGNEALLDLDKNLNCNLVVISLIYQLLDVIVCKYNASVEYKLKGWREL